MDHEEIKNKHAEQLGISSSKYARTIMQQAHFGQSRRDGKPYSTHPDKVVEILEMFGINDEAVLCAAYLHDVLEDTNTAEEFIGKEFGDNVHHLVKELTFGPTPDSDYVEQCRQLSSKAKLIKVADILANITDDGYKSEHFIRKRVNALRAMIWNTTTVSQRT